MVKATWSLVLLFLMVCQIPLSYGQQPGDLKLWYDEPAERWEEALPIGNGRIGAMIYGNPAHEEIQLNEETIYAGDRIIQ